MQISEKYLLSLLIASFIIINHQAISSAYTPPGYINISNRCGDGILDFPNEVCDDGNTANEDYCSSDCTTSTMPPPPAQTETITEPSLEINTQTSTEPNPMPTQTSDDPNTTPCGGSCTCSLTHPNCNGTIWIHNDSPSISISECQNNCITAGNSQCQTMYNSTNTTQTTSIPGY